MKDSGERIYYVARVSLWTQAQLLAAGVFVILASGLGAALFHDYDHRIWLMGGVGALIGVWLVVLAYFRYQTTEIILTNMRIVSRSGVFATSSNEIGINKVESMQITQTITGRMLDYGTVTISGVGGDHAPIVGVAAPQRLRQAFVASQAGSNRVFQDEVRSNEYNTK